MWWQLPSALVIIALIYVASKDGDKKRGNIDYKNEDDDGKKQPVPPESARPVGRQGGGVMV